MPPVSSSVYGGQDLSYVAVTYYTRTHVARARQPELDKHTRAHTRQQGSVTRAACGVVPTRLILYWGGARPCLRPDTART